MSGLCFGPPPRPCGRAGLRRILRASAWLVLCGTPGALFSTVAVSSWRERAESIRLAERGGRTICTVAQKYRIGKSFYLTLVREDLPRRGPFQVQVESVDWRSHQPGMRVPFYFDPARPDRGVAEVARSEREALAPILWVTGLGAGLTLMALGRAWGILGQILLLREGVELVTRGTGCELQVVHGDRVATLRRPFRVGLIQARAPARGYVVLAAPDLSRVFFPDLRDVPAGRLAREEGVRRVLPDPVRAPNPAWREWMRVELGSLRAMTLGFLGVAVLLGAIVGTASSPAAPGWGLTAAALPAFVGLLSGMAWAQAYWRGQVLWQEGEEVHAIVVEEIFRQGKSRYELAYRFGEREFRVKARLLREPWRVLPPAGDPIATSRVVVLVDARNPRRWTMVPAGV